MSYAQSAGVVFSIVGCSENPALFTRISTSPKSDINFPKPLATASASLISQTSGYEVIPSAASSMAKVLTSFFLSIA
jgi:hypothetical protein